MSKRESKKDLILSAGIEVMKCQGYNGTSVKDIVEAAGVPKGSFYNYFDSKEAFAIEALDKVATETYAISRSQLIDSNLAPMLRLQRYFEAGAECACSGEFKVGCFFGNMCQEMSDTNESIRLKVRQVLKTKTRLISEVLAEAQEAGQLSRKVDPEMLAEFIFNAWEGALMRMKASKSQAPLEAFLNTLPHLAH